MVQLSFVAPPKFIPFSPPMIEEDDIAEVVDTGLDSLRTDATGGRVYRVTAGVQFPVLHLAAINPYVTALMERQPGRWMAPRQPAALGMTAGAGSTVAEAAVVGVSAFAFQGTNAHALLSTAPVAGAAPAPMGVSVAWKQQRFWVAPPVHR